MLSPRLGEPIGALFAALLYWEAVSALGGVIAPWEAPFYWCAAYPISIIISGALGFLFRSLNWAAGAIFTLGQWPLLLASHQDWLASQMIYGFFYLLVLALPAIGVSAWATAARR